MQNSVRCCSIYKDVYFEEKLLEEPLKIIFVETKHIFQNKWIRNTTLPSREIPHAGVNYSSPIILAMILKMHLMIMIIWLYPCTYSSTTLRNLKQGAHRCQMCSWTCHHTSASSPVTDTTRMPQCHIPQIPRPLQTCVLLYPQTTPHPYTWFYWPSW